uniref:Uncharacterized protein n=1 Tax=Salarias fasciatus TaxID=181472 RepID=A0A672FDH9_SALFA
MLTCGHQWILSSLFLYPDIDKIRGKMKEFNKLIHKYFMNTITMYLALCPCAFFVEEISSAVGAKEGLGAT